MAISSKSGNFVLHAWQDNCIRLKATQGEGGIKIAQFTLVDGNGAIDLSTASSVSFDGIKRNGSGCSISCSITNAKNGIIEFVEKTGITDISGEVKGTINVVSSNGNIKFDGITLYVSPNTTEKLIEASDSFSSLTEALNKVAEITPEGTVSVDTTVTQNGSKPVTSGAVYNALLNKEDKSNKISSFGTDFSDAEKYPTVLAIKKFLDDYYYTFEDIDNFLEEHDTEALQNFGFNASVGFNEVYMPVATNEEKTFGEGTFTNKTEIVTVYIPNYVTKIQNGAFYGCTSLKDVYINNNKSGLTIESGAIPSTANIYYVDDFEFGKYVVKALKNINSTIINKAEKATTLEGYGITDAYTKSYIDKLLSNKLDKMGFDTEPMLNSPNYLTSGTVYTALQKKADKSTASELQVEITSLQNSLSELSNMIYANEYAATLIIDDDGTTFSDNNGDVMLADWKLKEA